MEADRINNIAVAEDKRLRFRRLDAELIPWLAPMMRATAARYRTCDFTVGGMFMWTDYFRYQYAVVNDTLFVMGLNENDLSTVAFSLPCGAMELRKSLPLLMEHCRRTGIKCVLSAVPETVLPEIENVVGGVDVEPLDSWSDYLYEIDGLSTLTGKKYGKKRNHVNRFADENPGYDFSELTSANLPDVEEFFERQKLAPDKSITADYERLQVREVLRRSRLFGFEGAVLTTPLHGVVAFAMGEVIGDTLYVHIEKMDHTVEGAGETVNKLFAAMMKERYPQLRFVNREEDAGDEGLRKAKLSYHPAAILTKYNVAI